MRANKKDFEAIVCMIRMMEKGETRRLMWAHALADLFLDSNPLFDKKRFVKAVQHGL